MRIDRRTLQNPAAVYVLQPLMIRHFEANVKGCISRSAPKRVLEGARRPGEGIEKGTPGEGARAASLCPGGQAAFGGRKAQAAARPG